MPWSRFPRGSPECVGPCSEFGLRSGSAAGEGRVENGRGMGMRVISILCSRLSLLVHTFVRLEFDMSGDPANMELNVWGAGF
jgi:hypothetical protein